MEIDDGGMKNKVLNSKSNSKDRDIIGHEYNKITPNEEGKISQDENLSYSDKKKSPNSNKSTTKSSSKFSASVSNEVLTKINVFK
jgi:hypothetical protein